MYIFFIHSFINKHCFVMKEMTANGFIASWSWHEAGKGLVWRTTTALYHQALWDCLRLHLAVRLGLFGHCHY